MDSKKNKTYRFINNLLYEIKTVAILFYLSIINYFKKVQLRRKSLLALKKMSDEQLKDIGLTRDDID
ncbi:DUF1127 domain-containing protein [Kosakonia sp. MUSA4]|uniref:DUF1127 domain-containing protein n=1 Tax=Kosakonia sp. MUSA4 TaxID=2067958 RepID=UPI00210FC914|nr:DUF1127 domain-containing protein [Kosakonia sp. MUSA4]